MSTPLAQHKELWGRLKMGQRVTVVGAVVATVALIYKVFPRRSPDWRTAVRGAALAAAVISVLSAAYVTYLLLGANFERRDRAQQGRPRLFHQVAVARPRQHRRLLATESM